MSLTVFYLSYRLKSIEIHVIYQQTDHFTYSLLYQSKCVILIRLICPCEGIGLVCMVMLWKHWCDEVWMSPVFRELCWCWCVDPCQRRFVTSCCFKPSNYPHLIERQHCSVFFSLTVCLNLSFGTDEVQCIFRREIRKEIRNSNTQFRPFLGYALVNKY